ncbi:hypothetical protein [Marmoricola sp. URHB0036]|uniref:hypothetical protein n=1 Tax=Marmoricola sp. URHB0036 TaxID=1298863 RepID=UPI00040CE0A3|nr:hypothetical protein [Marmoricola sp. URHB0036]
MTERLSTLLATEADAVDVPEARPDLIIRRARSFRLRRRATRGVVGVAAAAIVAAGVGLVHLDDSGTVASAQARFENAAAVPAYGTYGAFAAGSTIYIGNHKVHFEEKIKSIYYTSEGVLIRMGKRSYLDEPGPSQYTLIHPDGTTRQIDLRMGDRVPATDPQSPDIAYLEPTGSRWSFVVVDLRTGREVARKVVDGRFTWGGWEAPPASMSGTRVWGLFDEGWREFDWSTGKTRLVPGTRGAVFEAAHGRYLSTGDNGPSLTVADFATGATVRTTPSRGEETFATFSPDGRFLRISGYLAYNEKGELAIKPAPSEFLDLQTGQTTELPGQVYGWTPDGHTLSVDAKKDRITVCDPQDGSCDRIDLEIGDGAVKLGGASYES